MQEWSQSQYVMGRRKGSAVRLPVHCSKIADEVNIWPWTKNTFFMLRNPDAVKVIKQVKMNWSRDMQIVLHVRTLTLLSDTSCILDQITMTTPLISRHNAPPRKLRCDICQCQKLTGYKLWTVRAGAAEAPCSGDLWSARSLASQMNRHRGRTGPFEDLNHLLLIRLLCCCSLPSRP